MKVRFQDISEKEFEVMHQSVLRLLSEIGVLYEHPEANRLLKNAGNTIDSEGRIHLKPSFVEKMLDLIPKNGFMMYGRDESKQLNVAVDHINFRTSTGLPSIFDHKTKSIRPTTLDDARVMALVTDALDGFDMVNCAVNPVGGPHGVGALHLLINSHRYSMKPSDVTVMTKREVEGIVKIAVAIRGSEKELKEKPLTAVDVAMITPLRCTEEQVEAFLECAFHGIPIEVLSSPALGLTSPVTIAGGVAINIAEMIAALCLVYQITPGLGMINTARVTAVNMRTGALDMGMPEEGMSSLLVSACCKRYNIPVDSYGFGTGATIPGIQATMEKTFSGMLMALGNPFMVTGGGHLGNAMVTSPEQLVIENEMIRVLKRIRQTVTIDEDSIGVDIFKKFIYEKEDIISNEHTIRHIREGELMEYGIEQWMPNQELEKEKVLDQYDRANLIVEEIISSHSVPPFEPSVDKKIKQILDEY